MNFGARKKRAAGAAKAAGVNGLLVTHLPDVRYLCGFTGSNAALVIFANLSADILLPLLDPRRAG